MKAREASYFAEVGWSFSIFIIHTYLHAYYFNLHFFKHPMCQGGDKVYFGVGSYGADLTKAGLCYRMSVAGTE